MDTIQTLEFPSELGKLAADGRLTVPAEVRKATEWLKGKDIVRLIAELLEPGELRLHPEKSFLPNIRAKLTRLREGPEPDIHIAAFNDRFRTVTFYPSDRRIHLGQVISVFMQPDRSKDEILFLQACGAFVSVLTLEARNKRLTRLLSQLAVSAELENDIG